jgi:parvulin-like peptidyl-prolyl isomerase
MNGSDASVSKNDANSAGRRKRRWLWMLFAAAAVAAVCVAIRASGVPQVLAQAPIVRPGSPTLQARPTGAAAPAPTAARPATPAPTAQNRPAGSVPAAAAQAAAAQAQATRANALPVMAVVNGEQIPRAELGRECVRRYGEDVLESMINRQLIAEVCAQQGIQVTDADVTAEIERIANRFGLSRDRWITLLRDERGFTEEQYRREVVWPMLALRRVAASKVEVTQEEIARAYESEFGEKIRARLIAVDSREKADKARAKAVANPAAFGDVSKEYSVDAGVAAAYGVIPPIRKHAGDAGLEQAAFRLQPGQISEVIQVANMYYILKCEERLPQQQFLAGPQLAEQKARLAEKLKENKLRVAGAEFFEKVQKQAQVVNVLNDEKLSQQMPGVAATVNGRPITMQQLAEECLARHGQDVLDGEINRKILQQELSRKRQVVTEQDIHAEVSRAAEAYGHLKPDGQADVEKWLTSITEQQGVDPKNPADKNRSANIVDLYVRDAVWPSVALKKLVGGKAEVTQEDLQKAFESNYGERVEVLAIVLGDQRQAQKVWDLARNNPTDAFFAELAQQYSIEPASRSNGGKVPPIRRYGGSPVIEEAAFKLKKGELSGILSVEKQFIILRCQGRTQPVQVDFQSVRNNLYKDIEEKKLRLAMTKEFDRLREAAQVDNFLAGTVQNGVRTAASPALAAPAAATAAAPRTASPQPR